MWLIAGTVPQEDFGLYDGAVNEDCHICDGCLVLPDGRSLPVARGTCARAAAALLACASLGARPPRVLLAGDCGAGRGSREAYVWLANNVEDLARNNGLRGLTFHYFYPDLDAHNKLYAALESLRPRPLLVADAGFMYVAKMSGYARDYDLFTPDMGELAFLADERAPHPFYTRGFLLEKEDGAIELARRARSFENCPPNMIVKGSADYIFCDHELVAKISEPAVSAMECIGGTGDLVTGFASAFLAAAFPIPKATIMASQAARFLAEFIHPTPATQVAELVNGIPAMLKKFCSQLGL